MSLSSPLLYIGFNFSNFYLDCDRLIFLYIFLCDLLRNWD
ncbi:hypothetical protein FDUTEX481_02478 [Tolypothrix sp. PCC 7601]|nr:hypothetical protein FDUTEX481_02478 [Tolypothrix sp. PCC 7601]